MSLHFRNIILENMTNEKIKEKEFPDFLFKDSEVEFFKRFILTIDEYEFLGLERLYGDFCNLPYEYVKNPGAFAIIERKKQIDKKLGKKKNVVVEYLENHPYKNFNINHLTDREILEKFSDLSIHDLELLYAVFKNEEKVLPELTYYTDQEFCNHIILKNDMLKEFITYTESKKGPEVEKFQVFSKYSDHIEIIKTDNDDVYVALTEKGKKLIEWYQKEYLET